MAPLPTAILATVSSCSASSSSSEARYSASNAAGTVSRRYARHAGTARVAHASATATRRSLGASPRVRNSTTGSGGATPSASSQPAYSARTASTHASLAAGPTASGTHTVTERGVRTRGTAGSSPVTNRPRPRAPSPGAHDGNAIPSASASLVEAAAVVARAAAPSGQPRLDEARAWGAAADAGRAAGTRANDDMTVSSSGVSRKRRWCVARVSHKLSIHPSSQARLENSHSTRTPTCPIRVSRFTRARGRDFGIKTPEDRSDCERCLVTRGSNESGFMTEPPIGAFVSTRMRTQSLVFSARTKIQSRSNRGSSCAAARLSDKQPRKHDPLAKPRARFTNLTHSRPGRDPAELPASHTPIVHNKTTSCPLLP